MTSQCRKCIPPSFLDTAIPRSTLGINLTRDVSRFILRIPRDLFTRVLTTEPGYLYLDMDHTP